MKSKAHHLAQNKIDYIVFHNKKAVAELLYNQGFEPPEDAVSLAGAIKELSRKKGKKFIEELLQLHPDKKAILSLNPKFNASDCRACSSKSYITAKNYCSSCGHSNYIGSGDEDSFLGQFESYKDKELAQYYKKAVRKSNEDPKDKTLSQEVQMIWNEIRVRKENKAKESVTLYKKVQLISRDDLLLFGIVFISGVLVGHGLKFNTNYGK